MKGTYPVKENSRTEEHGGEQLSKGALLASVDEHDGLTACLGMAKIAVDRPPGPPLALKIVTNQYSAIVNCKTARIASCLWRTFG